MINFNETYNKVDKLVLTEEFVHEFMQVYSILAHSGKSLLHCLEKVTPFVYNRDMDADDDRTDVEVFRQKLKELSEEIYKNYHVLLRQLSITDDDESRSMRETLRRVIEIDREFNDDFDEMIDAIKVICFDDNEGLDSEFYKLREKFFIFN